MQIQPAGAIKSIWGEGAIWWEGWLLYVDIESGIIHGFDPVTSAEQSWKTNQRIGTVVPRLGGGFVVAGDHGFSFLDKESGELCPIGDPESKKVDNRFNDGKCAPDGYFFAGTISLVKKTGDADLYRLSPNLEITHAYGPVTNSNGIAWSSGGETCYYIDTPTKAILAFDYQSGVLNRPREVVSTRAFDSSPDGMTIDDQGNLWVAFCHGGCVVCFDPRTGKQIEKIDLPCLETTSCAFGGASLEDLYVTTGVHKTEEEELAGRLLVIQGLGVKGVPAHPFPA